MGQKDTTRIAKDDDGAAARPAGQVAVRFEPAGDAAGEPDADAGADEYVAPALEEAGYGYGV